MHLTRARLPGSLRRLNFIRRRSALIIATACCWHVLPNAHVGFVPGPTKNLIPVSTPVSSVAAAVAAPFIAVSTNPATAAAAGFATTATDDAPIDPQNAIVQAFLLTLVSEIGDKTFFIAAILAAGGSQEGQGQNQKILTFVGAILALVVMTLLAVGIGQIFHSVPDVAGGLPLDDYASILAFGYFGVKLLYDSTQMEDDGSLLDEKEEAEEDIKSVALPGFLSGGVASLVLPPLVLQAFVLVFAAEIGDRSFISAAALSAQGGPTGALAVFIGGISAHTIATLIAVVLGELISKYITEKQLGLIGGGLFLIFAASSAAKVAGVAGL